MEDRFPAEQEGSPPNHQEGSLSNQHDQSSLNTQLRQQLNHFSSIKQAQGEDNEATHFADSREQQQIPSGLEYELQNAPMPHTSSLFTDPRDESPDQPCLENDDDPEDEDDFQEEAIE